METADGKVLPINDEARAKIERDEAQRREIETMAAIDHSCFRIIGLARGIALLGRVPKDGTNAYKPPDLDGIPASVVVGQEESVGAAATVIIDEARRVVDLWQDLIDVRRW